MMTFKFWIYSKIGDKTSIVCEGIVEERQIIEAYRKITGDRAAILIASGTELVIISPSNNTVRWITSWDSD